MNAAEMEQSSVLLQQQQQWSSQQQLPGQQVRSFFVEQEKQAINEIDQPSTFSSCIGEQAQEEQLRMQQQSSCIPASAAVELMPTDELESGKDTGITADVGCIPPVFAALPLPSPLSPYPSAASALTTCSTDGTAATKPSPYEALAPCSNPDAAAASTFLIPTSPLPCHPAAAAIGSTETAEFPVATGSCRNSLGVETSCPNNSATVAACCPSAFRSSSSDVLPSRAAAPRLRYSAAASDPGTKSTTSSSSSSHTGTSSSRRYDDASAGFRGASHNSAFVGRDAGCRSIINDVASQTFIASSSQVTAAASSSPCGRVQHDTLPFESGPAAAPAAPTECPSCPTTTRDNFVSSSSTLDTNLISSSSLTTSSGNNSLNISMGNSGATTSNSSNKSVFTSGSNSSGDVRRSSNSVRTTYREISTSPSYSMCSSTAESGDGLVRRLPRPLSASVLKRLLEVRRCKLRKTPLLRFLEGNGSIDCRERRRKRKSGRKMLSNHALSNHSKMFSCSAEALSFSSGEQEDSSPAGGSPQPARDSSSTTGCAAASVSPSRTAAVETSAAVRHASPDTGLLEEAGGSSSAMLAGCRTPINILLYYAGDVQRRGRSNSRSSAGATGHASLVENAAAAAGGAGNSSSDDKSKGSPHLSSNRPDSLRIRCGATGSSNNHTEGERCSPMDGGVKETSNSMCATPGSTTETSASGIEELQQMNKHEKKDEQTAQRGLAANGNAALSWASGQNVHDSLEWCGERILQQTQTEPLLAKAVLRARRYRPLFHQSVLADAALETLKSPAGGLKQEAAAAGAARGGDTADDMGWSTADSTEAVETAAAGPTKETCRGTPSFNRIKAAVTAGASARTTNRRDWETWRQWEDADLVPPPQELDELLTVLASAVKVRIAEVMALACGAEAAEHMESKIVFPKNAENDPAFDTAAAAVLKGLSARDVGGRDVAAPAEDEQRMSPVEPRMITSEETDNWNKCGGRDSPTATETRRMSQRVLRLRHILQAAAELPTAAALTSSLRAAV